MDHSPFRRRSARVRTGHGLYLNLPSDRASPDAIPDRFRILLLAVQLGLYQYAGS